ncbi:YadA-like family protein [Haemophilus influenzae]|nr:YadA-like family protein [Haemophilus influenzae]
MGLGNIAIGVNAEAQGNDIKLATSIGTFAKANNSGALALGGSSEALGIFSIAEGYSANSDGYGAIAIGSAAKIKQLEKGKINHIAGQNNKGLDVDADGNVTKITIRTESEKDILSKYGQTYGAMALGFRSSSHNLFASSFGAFSTATAIESLAVGDSSQSTGYRSATFGSHSRALAEESLALGYETRANAYGSVALGAESVANEKNTVSVGSDTLKRKIVNVADGTEDYDAVNVRQLNAVETKIGQVNNRFAQVDNKFTQVNNRLDNTDNKLGQIDNQLTQVDSKFTQVDNKFTQVNNRLDNTDNKLGQIDNQLTQVDSKFTQVDNKFTQVNNRLDNTDNKLGQIDNQFTQVNNNFTQVNNRLDGTETKLGQIDNQFTHVNTRLNRTDLRINRVGASAAALASLKPAQLGEDDKFALSLGVGSYKNAQAMAMGAVFKPAENVLLNVAGSFSGSEKTFGAGVSWKFGNKSKPAVSTQSAVSSAEVLQLRQEVVMMRSQQVETNKKLHKQAEMESELKQLRRELLELKKALNK